MTVLKAYMKDGFAVFAGDDWRFKASQDGLDCGRIPVDAAAIATNGY
jgi:hypothetical protein